MEIVCFDKIGVLLGHLINPTYDNKGKVSTSLTLLKGTDLENRFCQGDRSSSLSLNFFQKPTIWSIKSRILFSN